MNIEGPPVKAVPESVRRRPSPQSSPFRAVPECFRSRAPPPPEGTLFQQTPTWPVEDANTPWTARERTVIAEMVRYLEKSEQIQVDISELEHFLLGTEDAEVSIRSLAENVRVEGGYSRFVLLDTPRGKGGGRGAKVADTIRCINGPDHSWTAWERAELRQQDENDAKYLENTLGRHLQSEEGYTACTVV